MDNEDFSLFEELREHSKQKRERNRRYSTALLTLKNIKFEAKNNGYHLIIDHFGLMIDFWPSTGLWRVRKSDVESKRGVNHLLAYLKEHEK